MNTYGLLFAVATLSAYLIIRTVMFKEGFSKKQFLIYVLYLFTGVIVGARLFHTIFYNPMPFLEVFQFWKGGLSSHGAILGALGMTYLYSEKDFWKLADISTMGIAFAGIFVRLGNYFNNEIVGRLSSNGRYPVQLYESLMSVGISLSLIYLYIKEKFKVGSGLLFWWFILVYSLIRFFLEFFKEYMVFTFGLTMGQRISLVFFVVSVLVLYSKKD